MAARATKARPSTMGASCCASWPHTPPASPTMASVRTPATRWPSLASRCCQPRSRPTSRPMARAMPRSRNSTNVISLFIVTPVWCIIRVLSAHAASVTHDGTSRAARMRSCHAGWVQAEPTRRQAMITAQQALERLRAGNQRFVDGQHGNLEAINPARRDQLATGQEPFAVILGCSDSRVPPELLFDQGLGDLFVIRVAGNIVSDDETGSVEFAVQAFNTPLVIVLGHSSCGSITRAVDAAEQPDTELPAA